jgi:CheY-like chemotaxis protein
MRPVLVIEDDQDCRELLQRWLDLLGVPVLTANHGAEGLRVAREQKPCLILLDFMMPIMGGREFRLIQAADSAINDVPVVLTSAHPHARDFASDLDLQRRHGETGHG